MCSNSGATVARGRKATGRGKTAAARKSTARTTARARARRK